MDTKHKKEFVINNMKVIMVILIVFIFSGCAKRIPMPVLPEAVPKETWDDLSQWQISTDNKSVIEVNSVLAEVSNGLEIKYVLKNAPHGWVMISKHIQVAPPEDIPITFFIKASGGGDLEIKFIDDDGSVFGRKIPLRAKYGDWTKVVIYLNNTEYWWGGDGEFNGLKKIEFAFSGKGRGTVWLDEISLGDSELAASFPPTGPVLDPDRELAGIGFRQRRHEKMIPEDPLVLEWLKQIQDSSSMDKKLLPSMEGSQFQTFNNSLVAIAYILKGEKERSERILDFFAEATDKENQSPTLQNFFYKGEARGFFQYVSPRVKDGQVSYHNPGKSDRWMGDLAWLLCAYKFYEETYDSDRYEEITGLIKGLLISWYVDSNDGPGGYIQHGWRKDDTKLHESYGHPEGNIDAYAALKLCGEDEYAKKVKVWLDRNLKGNAQPLDHYTWSALAHGKEAVHLLDIPDFDFRYRKILSVNGQKVMGFYPFADINADNIWLDGTGHMACAYFAGGNIERGNFYADQYDLFLVDREINGFKTRAIPYAANRTNEYSWVDVNKGFVSTVAWYIFAKNGFNPLRLTKARLDE